MKSRIFLKLFAAALLIIAVCALTMNVLIHTAWEDMLRSEIETSLRQKTLLFASRMRQPPPESIRKINQRSREAAGCPSHRHRRIRSVLADSEANPDTMENHATRPEFVAAYMAKLGSDIAISHTLGIPFLYVAAPVPGGAVAWRIR